MPWLSAHSGQRKKAEIAHAPPKVVILYIWACSWKLVLLSETETQRVGHQVYPITQSYGPFSHNVQGTANDYCSRVGI